MACGWKPAAYFCDGADVAPGVPEQALMAMAAAGIVEHHERRLPMPAPRRFPIALREAIYVLPGRTDLVDLLRRLTESWTNHRPDIGHRTEFAFAGALGYGPEDIASFIWHAYGRLSG
jgi:hypothetical protein